MVAYAPTKEILDDYKKGKIDWAGYEERFIPLIEKRHIEETFLRISLSMTECFYFVQNLLQKNVIED